MIGSLNFVFLFSQYMYCKTDIHSFFLLGGFICTIVDYKFCDTCILEKSGGGGGGGIGNTSTMALSSWFGILAIASWKFGGLEKG